MKAGLSLSKINQKRDKVKLYILRYRGQIEKWGIYEN